MNNLLKVGNFNVCQAPISWSVKLGELLEKNLWNPKKLAKY